MTLQLSRNITVIMFIVVYLTQILGFYKMTFFGVYFILYFLKLAADKCITLVFS